MNTARKADVVLIAAWFAIVTGLMEAAVLAIARYRLHRYTHLPADLIWMSPTASLIVFGVVALLLLVIAAFWPRLPVVRVSVFVLAVLGLADVLLIFKQLHLLAVLILSLGAATQIERLIHMHWASTRRLVRLSLGPLALVAVAGGVAYHLALRNAERHALSSLGPPPRGAPNVLFIIWDTVRAVNLSLLGYHRPTTPVLERFAREGAVFTHAMASAPWTLPSHASMFTGAYPHQISADWADPLDDRAATVAEHFARHGYNTGGFVANVYYCSRESGLERGFIHYEDFKRADLSQILMGSALVRAVYAHYGLRHKLGLDEEPGRKSAAEINDAVLKWVNGKGDRPFFAFLNYFDAHAPYLPPVPFDTMFGPMPPHRNAIISEERELSAAQLKTEVAAYDGAIAYLDRELGRLLDRLAASGVLDNTIVVIAADHGEQFGEHGLINHGNSLYQPLLHVPLVIHAPNRVPAGARIEDWVSMRDVAATLVDLASLPGDHKLSGSSLARFWSADRPRGGDTLLAEVSRASGLPPRYPASEADMRSIMAQPYQFIWKSTGSTELYNVETDPAQLNDIVNSLPLGVPAANRFKAILREFPAQADR